MELQSQDGLPHDGIASVLGRRTEEEHQPVGPDDLARWRRQLLRILDQLDDRRPPNSGPGARVARLREASRIPRNIAAWMKAILEVRNAAEYEAREPSKAEGEAVRNAWSAVLEWAAQQQLTV